MPFTSADLDIIDAAIARGELSVSYRDRSVTYRSLDDLLREGDFVKKALEASSPDRLIPRHQVTSFSDG